MISKFRFAFLATAATAFLILTSCSSEQVVVRHQAPPPKTPAKNTTKKPPEAAKPPPVVAATPAKPIQDLKIVPKVQTPDALLKSLNNMKEANDLIENKLNLNELDAAAADPALEVFKPQLLLKIGNLYLQNKDPDKASEYFRALTTLYPQTVYASQASVTLAGLQGATEAESNVIGAILPLTGKNASVGQHALNAIRLGLELNKNEKKFRIALFDSQSDPELAARGVDKLANEDKAIAILGGFSAKEATSIAQRAELLSVPFIAFSQKPGLTGVGEYVFRNAVTPEMQVNRLVDFAFEKLKARRFAILYPNDSYGVEFSNVFWDHVLARGGQVTAAEIYDPKTNDFSEPIQKMVGTYYEEARADEIAQILKDKKLAEKKREKEKALLDDQPAKPTVKNQRDSITDANILPPVVDFDVLFVPDSSKALGQIIAFMKFNDVQNMNYLGTNLWNTSDLPKRAAGEDANIYFSAGVDINDLSIRESEFFRDYVQNYNEEPTLVEVQAYEASRALKNQITNGVQGRESLALALRGLQSSPGVAGDLKMSPQREFMRPINVLKLETGIVKKVE